MVDELSYYTPNMKLKHHYHIENVGISKIMMSIILKMRFIEKVFTFLLHILLIPLVSSFVILEHRLLNQCVQRIVMSHKHFFYHLKMTKVISSQSTIH